MNRIKQNWMELWTTLVTRQEGSERICTRQWQKANGDALKRIGNFLWIFLSFLRLLRLVRLVHLSSSLSLLFPTFHIEFHQSNKDVGGIFFLEDLSRTEQLKDHFPSAQNCGEHIQSINYVDEWKVQANFLFLSTYVGFFFFSLFFFLDFFYLSVSCSFYVFIFVVVHRVRGETLVALKALVDLKRTMQRFISAWVPFDCIRSQFESFDFRSKDSGP